MNLSINQINKNIKKLIAVSILLSFLIAMFSLCFFASAKTIDDGIYEVNIALWHSSKDKPSMAKDAIKPKAKIVVKNSVGKLYLTVNPTKIMGMNAHLYELKIKNSSGSYTNASVTKKDSEGKPLEFCFTLTNYNQYIDAKVNPHVAMMGNKEISARIKVDYSSLKPIQKFEKPTKKSNVSTGKSNKKSGNNNNYNEDRASKGNGNINNNASKGSKSKNSKDIIDNKSLNKVEESDSKVDVNSDEKSSKDIESSNYKKSKDNIEMDKNANGESQKTNSSKLSKEEKKSVVIIIVCCVLLLLMGVSTLIYFLKFRKK